MPGPGTYTVAEKVGKEGRNVSLKGRPKSGAKDRCSPGPAQYNPNEAIIKANAKTIVYLTVK
jgi:hypothetical protein